MPRAKASIEEGVDEKKVTTKSRVKKTASKKNTSEKSPTATPVKKTAAKKTPPKKKVAKSDKDKLAPKKNSKKSTAAKTVPKKTTKKSKKQSVATETPLETQEENSEVGFEKDPSESVTRKAPTAFAKEAANRRARNIQICVVSLLLFLGVGASAAVGFTDNGQINVTQTIRERNERMANMVEVNGPTVVAAAPVVADGGFVAVADSAAPATVVPDPVVATSTEVRTASSTETSIPVSYTGSTTLSLSDSETTTVSATATTTVEASEGEGEDGQ